MRRFVAAAVVLAAACGGSDKTTGPTNISGTWQFSDAVNNQQLSESCTSTASVNIVQNGSTFRGTVVSGSQTCNGPGGQTSGSLAGGTMGGLINGASVSFSDVGGCFFTGTLSGSPVNRVSGNETCMVPIQGTSYTFTGTWQVTR